MAIIEKSRVLNTSQTAYVVTLEKYDGDTTHGGIISIHSINLKDAQTDEPIDVDAAVEVIKQELDT